MPLKITLLSILVLVIFGLKLGYIQHNIKKLGDYLEQKQQQNQQRKKERLQLLGTMREEKKKAHLEQQRADDHRKTEKGNLYKMGNALSELREAIPVIIDDPYISIRMRGPFWDGFMWGMGFFLGSTIMLVLLYFLLFSLFGISIIGLLTTVLS
ncbi:hypothetical protein JW930_00295 [Candidatus Woesearchaeota archaeon]|nr:hypothetical protein [Candidatus Woesearchaeota archaeon]